jgi:hypothetical protein
MHTEAEIFELLRLGQLQPLTAQSLPTVAARLQEISAHFQRAMDTGFVGGNPLPAHFHGIVASAKLAKPSRARAVAALIKAGQIRRSTKRRK